MRLLLVLCLAAATYANEKEVFLGAAKRTLASGRTRDEGQHVMDRARRLTGDHPRILELCRFAADASIAFEVNLRNRHTRESDAELNEMCDRLAALARNVGPSALAEIDVFRARLMDDTDGLRRAATTLVDLEGEAKLRAIEYLLQLGDADAIRGIAESAEGAARESAQAAVLLLAGKVQEGLEFCRKPPHLLRRYNDFVSLDRARGRKTEYRMVDREDQLGKVRYQLPLSRQWVVLDYRTWGGRKATDLYLCDERGRLRARVDIRRYAAGDYYPVVAPRKADGRNPKKLAEAFMAFDGGPGLGRLTQGPKRVRGMRKVKKAYWYETWSLNPGGKRVRHWFCTSGGDSYGIRVDYYADTPRHLHPELDEFLPTFEIKK